MTRTRRTTSTRQQWCDRQARDGEFWKLVIDDIRKHIPGFSHLWGRGTETTDGVGLLTDPLMEAYNDALDMACHLKQALVERDAATRKAGAA